MTAYFFPPKAHPALIHYRRHARNGRLPEAAFMRRLVDAHNYTLYGRRKELFRYSGGVQSITAGSAGTTDRWAFRCHTGTGVGSIRILMGMAQTSSGTDPYVQWYWTVSGGSTSTLDPIRYGRSINTPTDEPDDWGWVEQVWTGVQANTTYEVRCNAVDYARPFAVCIWEQPKTAFLNTDTAFIGLQPSVHSPIFDAHRQGLAEKSTALWKYNARQLWNWSKDVSATTNATTTWTNAIDGTSTTVASTTPGATLDTTYDRRLSQTTIPCVFAVRAHKTGTNNAEVRLQSASGTIASITGITATSPTWYSTTVNLTPGVTKMDLQFRASGATTTASIAAASLYEYEA